MAGLRLYTVIYFALMFLAFTKWALFEGVGMGLLTYNQALGGTMVAAVLKVSLIAGYYQHLREEPRTLTYLYLSALAAVGLLAVAASYSITP